MSTNYAQAGTSSTVVSKPTLQLVEQVEIYKSSMLEDCFDYSILISNNISMARDQLANERNWLTWFRLSCTLILLGFSILIQFRLPDPTAEEQPTVTKIQPANKSVGLIFCIIGFSCFFVGLGKYFKSQKLLVKQATYVQAGWGSYVMVAILFLFVCTVMILALH
ncbi:hypothetical protein INT48_001703 [Thamnidium elegans]|uniref:DUF202 domain-containing protein n=1 Tax=Thamnidium elegans TaxID=101142 RepID=A0A8H7SPI5_9FUNG|nr:hypothetical protein INT48_001703 [Thamnidium elegans]